MFDVVGLFYLVALALYFIAITKIPTWKGQLGVVGFTFILSCLLSQTNNQPDSHATIFAASFAWVTGLFFFAYLWFLFRKHNDLKKYLDSQVDIGRKKDFNEFFLNK